MTPNNPPPGPSDAALSSIVVNSGYGGLHATILSAVALVLSAFSLYEASFKTAELEIFIPPVIQYARDGGGDTELFVVPITVTNSGARTGTVLSMELSVEDLKTKRVKRYYSAFLGEHQVDRGRAQPLVRAAVHSRARHVQRHGTLLSDRQSAAQAGGGSRRLPVLAEPRHRGAGETRPRRPRARHQAGAGRRSSGRCRGSPSSSSARDASRFPCPRRGGTPCLRRTAGDLASRYRELGLRTHVAELQLANMNRA